MGAVQQLDHSAPFENDDLVALIPQMRTFARNLCRNATLAEDLTQEALARAWRRRASYTPGTNMRAWVFMIIRNLFFSEHRRSARVSQLDSAVAEETLMATFNPTAPLELDEIRRGMLELNAEQRRALNLICVSGLSYFDAALVCGCAEGTMKSRISRGRQALAAIMAEGDFSGEPRPPGLAMATILYDADRACGPATTDTVQEFGANAEDEPRTPPRP